MFGQKDKENEKPDFEYFTLFDTKACIYREPMLALNKFDMMRQIENLYQDPKQNMNVIVTNAEDFQLFKVGAFSKRTGKLFNQPPEHVVNLTDLKAAALQKNRPNGPMGIIPT